MYGIISPRETRTLERPGLGLMLIFLCREGNRRSPSTTRTRSPCSASVLARFSVVVLLPSPRIELVTPTIRPLPSTASGSENMRLVRSILYASLAEKFMFLPNMNSFVEREELAFLRCSGSLSILPAPLLRLRVPFTS